MLALASLLRTLGAGAERQMGAVMRRLLAVTGLALSMALATAVPAAAQTDKSMQNCGRVIEKQSEKGIVAGGGPKAGIPAPTNCDHFFQNRGSIGNQQ